MSQQAQVVVQAQQKTAERAATKGSLWQHAAINTTVTPVHSGILQRCSGSVECAACRQKRLEKEGTLQRAAVNSAPANGVPPIVHNVLGSSGQPLDAGTRTFMEPRFGHDFSQVRVHADARAAESARAVNALAYTVGRDVVFGVGQYEPGTNEGRRLLAHELTHVVQQGTHDSGSMQGKLVLGQPNDAFEEEADHVAVAVTGGRVVETGVRMNTPFLQEKASPLDTLSCALMPGPLPGMPICVNSGGCPGQCILHNPFPLPPYCICQPSSNVPEPPLVLSPPTGPRKAPPEQTSPVQAPPAQTPQAQTPSTQMQPAPRPRAAAGTGGIHDHLHYVVYDNEVRVEGSRAWRTNNPGNLEYHQFARDHGAIGPDGRNAVFPDEQTGAEAIAALLQTNTYQLLTIREAITRYAPPDENDTEDYINTIRRQTGLDPNTRMSSLTPNQLMSVVRTIRVVEGWRPGQVYTCANSNTPALTWIHDLLGCVP